MEAIHASAVVRVAAVDHHFFMKNALQGAKCIDACGDTMLVRLRGEHVLGYKLLWQQLFHPQQPIFLRASLFLPAGC